nr:MAG: ORF1 [TTV-like mini virus]
MPPYWRPFYYYRRRRPRYRQRRLRNFRWRTGTTFRRTRYRRKRFYKRKVKKRHFKRKRLTLKIRMFQPKSINLCKIIGYKCLFQGSPFRKQHNWIQYIYSYATPKMVAGGGWSLQIFSLDSMFEDWQHLQSLWTKSNAGLPLVRLLGFKFKFYQSKYDDYAVVYDNCYPMVDTPHTHADSAPGRMLQKQKKIIIPSRQTQTRKKPFKKIFVKPPAQFTNKWYFQRDICKIPLLMLTTTSIDLQQPFAPSNVQNNNILIKYLNPNIFKNNNFQEYSKTSGYSPKSLNGEPYYLYADPSGQNMDINNKTWIKQLIPLINTKDYQAGANLEHIVANGNDKPSNWGNPFYHTNLDKDASTIYLANYNTSTFKTNWTQTQFPNLKMFKATENLIYETVYNPDIDTGDSNQIYLIKNTQETHFQPLPDTDFQFDGFPLYYLLWGWTDFLRKLDKVTNIDNSYTLMIKTKVFHEKDEYFCIVDSSFIHGFDPFTPETEENHTPSYYNRQNWYPKLAFQEETIESICETGPAVSKSKNYMQAYCKYTCYVKWGGCPKTLEKAYNPCSQPHWTTPNSIDARLAIQNPNEPPETTLYDWDWFKDYVKPTAIQRIKDYTQTDEKIFSITESHSSAKATTPQTQATKEEKDEEALLLKLQQLRKQRVHLELLIRMKEQSLL